MELINAKPVLLELEEPCSQDPNCSYNTKKNIPGGSHTSLPEDFPSVCKPRTDIIFQCHHLSFVKTQPSVTGLYIFVPKILKTVQ